MWFRCLQSGTILEPTMPIREIPESCRVCLGDDRNLEDIPCVARVGWSGRCVHQECRSMECRKCFLQASLHSAAGTCSPFCPAHAPCHWPIRRPSWGCRTTDASRRSGENAVLARDADASVKRSDCFASREHGVGAHALTLPKKELETARRERERDAREHLRLLSKSLPRDQATLQARDARNAAKRGFASHHEH